MPIQRCTVDGKPGWRWGNQGKCYRSRSAALRQARAIKSSQARRGVTSNVRAPNPLRADPTRTATLRRVAERDFSKRWLRLKRRIIALVVEEDAFGLKQENRNDLGGVQAVNRRDRHVGTGREQANGGDGTTSRTLASPAATEAARRPTHNTRWRFASDPQKVTLFRSWLETQLGADVLAGVQGENAEDAYWAAYVEDGYRKGAGRAFTDVRAAEVAASAAAPEFFEGSRQEFLRSMFGHPVSVEKVKLLAGRVFTDLQGVTSAMATTMSRTLTDGLVQGQGPREIARTLNRQLDIGRKRALTIARTEIVRAHAEGQLDAMERLGVESVGVMVEWSTAGDDRVCSRCIPLDGIVLTLKEARGIIPRHPNCRCAHVPANVGEDKRGQKRGKTKVRSAFDKSIKAERKRGSLREKKRLSTWPGADKRIAKKRPRGIV